MHHLSVNTSDSRTFVESVLIQPNAFLWYPGDIICDSGHVVLHVYRQVIHTLHAQ